MSIFKRKKLALWEEDIMERKDQIKEFLKRAKSEGDLSGEGILLPRKSLKSSLLQGRDLAEEALAYEVLKNTGVPIPGKGASRSQIENFLQDIAKERYPELGDLDLDLVKGLSADKGAYALYNTDTDKMLMSDCMLAIWYSSSAYILTLVS